VSTFVLAAIAGVVVLVIAVVVVGLMSREVARSHRLLPLSSGPGALLGQETTVHRSPDGVAQGFVAGAWWTLRSLDAPLADGDRVWVVDVDGLVLVVETIAPASPPGPDIEGNR
jgi:membrane protein implicated in regulation of membrane protease activity